MMRLLYDYQCFTQRTGGVSRYFHEITSRIAEYPGTEITIPVLFSSNIYLDHKRKLFPQLQFHGRGFITEGIHRRYMSTHLSRAAARYNLFHPTYYDGYFLRYLGHMPFVVTIHDMTHELFPERFRDAAETSVRKRRLVEHAAKIIAVSENTKRDLMTRFAVAEERIEVIYHGSSLRSSNGTVGDRQDYLLFVGAREGYKNFLFALEALAETLKRYDLRLICAGGRELSLEERTAIHRLDLTNLVQHAGGINDDELARLYGSATLLVYPSLYEGFGIPMLEAFNCGCPVAASSTSSLPEVGGEAARYFDPRDADSIRTAVESLLDDRDLRSDLVERGKRRASLFSWDKTARETYDVYENLLSL